jgi:hypothetical protein
LEAGAVLLLDLVVHRHLVEEALHLSEVKTHQLSTVTVLGLRPEDLVLEEAILLPQTWMV